jgi:hypothetical protein
LSVQALAAVFQLEIESPTVKLVLLALANHADADGRCWPSQKTLAGLTSLSERAIRSALDVLTKDGWIGREERRRPDGSRASDVVTLLFLQAAPAAGSRETQPAPAAGGGAFAAGGGAPAAGHEPSTNLSEGPNAPSENTKTASAISIPEGFPDADALAWARSEAASHARTLNVEMRAKRFRAHAEQSGRRERDWSAAWRGWVWTALEDAPGAKPEKPPPKAAVIALDPDEIERRWAQAVEV